MEVRTEKQFVISMSATEAGVLLCLVGMVAGKPESMGRAVTEALRRSLAAAGAIAVDAFEDTSIEAR